MRLATYEKKAEMLEVSSYILGCLLQFHFILGVSHQNYILVPTQENAWMLVSDTITIDKDTEVIM